MVRMSEMIEALDVDMTVLEIVNDSYVSEYLSARFVVSFQFFQKLMMYP